MTAVSLCGYKQFACLSARATGKRGENNLAWVIAFLGLAILAISIFAIFSQRKVSTSKTEIEESQPPFSVVR